MKRKENKIQLAAGYTRKQSNENKWLSEVITRIDLTSLLHVSGQFHNPVALPPGKGPPGTQWRDWMSPRAGLDLEAEEKHLPVPGTQPRSSSTVFAKMGVAAPQMAAENKHAELILIQLAD
jgi:hypothetical protein